MIISQRHLFSVPDEITYLNCAYLSPQLNAVTAAGQKAVLRKQHPWEIMPADFFSEVIRLKQLFAKLIDANPQDIAIVPSTSYGISTAAKNLPIKRSQTIVIMAEEFPSNVYRWYELAKETGAVIKTIAHPADDDWTTAILNHLDHNTAIAALTHCHWTDGSLIDLEKISEVCQQNKIALVVDTTQSLGAMPFSVKKIDADFMVVSGYKWLLGPYGLSFMYVAPHRQNGLPIEYSWITRKGSQDFSKLTQYEFEYEPGAARYDMGQRSQFIHVTMACAAIEQLLAWGVTNIYATLKNYTTEIADEFAKIGVTCVNPQFRAGHMLGVKMPENTNMSALAAELRQQKIYISTPGAGNIRVSPHLYNTQADQQRFVKALATFLQ